MPAFHVKHRIVPHLPGTSKSSCASFEYFSSRGSGSFSPLATTGMCPRSQLTVISAAKTRRLTARSEGEGSRTGRIGRLKLNYEMDGQGAPRFATDMGIKPRSEVSGGALFAARAGQQHGFRLRRHGFEVLQGLRHGQ